MPKPEKPGTHQPMPKLGPKDERTPHEIRPSERQIPANRPAAPPIPNDED